MNRFPFPLRWLRSIWAMVGAIVAGVLVGLYEPRLAEKLVPYGNLYLSFLKMCVIPIMVTAIIASVGRLFMSTGSFKVLRRMTLVFLGGLLLAGLLGLGSARIGHPGEGFSSDQRMVLGQEVLDREPAAESADAGAGASAAGSGLLRFVFDLIPSNIFIALGQGDSLQILFFSVVVGMAVGLLSVHAGDQFLLMTDLLFKAFQRMISWAMYVLPAGMFCLMAGQIAGAGAALLLAMVKYIACIYAASLLLLLLGAGVVSVKLKLPFLRTLRGLKEPLWIAFGTQNSIATMPYVLETLRDRFKLNANTVNLVVPLGIVLCRYSMVLTYTTGIVFIAQLYGVSLDMQGWLIALSGAILAAVAGAGSPGIVSIGMISLIADPLHLPYATGVILLMAVNPIIDPGVTTANIMLNCASTVLIADSGEDASVFADEEASKPRGSAQPHLSRGATEGA
ncbi:dicarboxylate/amino acid:cation symporter [Cohnella nanjingensis]|uniref:Cation:dicarboxylase symporter family transporter n=1 Tax=Cohnella nanjingensis TaxID=1387779 RepID=A0A7X0VH45_9BACL|nr:cation:dicarboxylase symporter family transporter [Cohnella nanjingensis]MBB6673762.1 cation:dicarboxylase symporter family transporter [Cohnella nanjingensis]